MSCRVLCRCSTARRRMRNCKRCMASIHWSSSIRSMCKFRRRRCKEGGYALNNAKNAFRGASLSLTSTIIRQKHTVTNPALSHLRHALNLLSRAARQRTQHSRPASPRPRDEEKRTHTRHVAHTSRAQPSTAHAHTHTGSSGSAAIIHDAPSRHRTSNESAAAQPPASGRAQRTRPADAPSGRAQRGRAQQSVKRS